jgi:uncharacterized protein
MKHSRYNLVVEDGDRVLAVNLLSRAAIELSADAYQSFVTITTNDDSDDDTIAFRRHLAENLFILPNDFDELAYIKTQTMEARYDESQLGVVIAPTIGCNFSCHYCFENRTSGDLSDVAEEKIIALVRESIAGRTDLAVQWFGGEPLQSLPSIERLSLGFLRLAVQHDVRYAATVITNGYLMTAEVAEKLERWGVRSVQISLDGDRPLHDRTRFEEPGKGSFDRILENIRTASHRFEIKVRVHVAPFSVASVLGLIDTLAQRDMARHIELYFAPLFNYRAGMTSQPYAADGKRFMTAREFAAIQLPLLRSAKAHGFRTADPLASSYGICTAVRGSTLVVDPSGNLLKCYKDVGNAAEAYGNILDPTAANEPNRAKWMDIAIPRDEECGACDFLPICLGGCTKQWHEGASKDVICTPLKFNWRERLPLEL